MIYVRIKKFLLLILISAVAYCSAAQSLSDSIISIYEDTLCGYFTKQNQQFDIEKKMQINDSILGVFDKILSDKNCFEHNFQKLDKLISIKNSPDNKFRIYNWDVTSNGGQHTYFAILQVVTMQNIIVRRLTDKSVSIQNPEQQQLSADNWFGALYYSILSNKVGKKNYYTIIGWDGNDLFTNKKLVDVLWFDSNDEPKFGAPIFCTNIKEPKETKCRVIFEYSYKCSITLTYNQKLNMIVFDHLSPVSPMYRGMYEYYGTDFSYDAFVFDNGKWQIREDIDVRNPKPLKKKPNQ